MAEQSYKYYDFTQAEVISKDAVRTISYIFENFSRLLGTSLSTYFRMATEVVLESVEQLDYADLSAGISAPSSLTIFGIRPLNGLALMDISLNFVFLAIDRLLGGGGSAETLPRELTDIERSIADRLAKKVLSTVQEAWAHIVSFYFTVEGSESSPQMIQVFSHNERMLALNFRVKTADMTGHILLAFSAASFEPLRQKLTSQDYAATVAEGSAHEEEEKLEYQALVRNLGKVKIPVIARLGETQMSLTQIMNLKEDDMIKLLVDQTSLLDIVVKDKVKFQGVIGALGSKKAIQVEKIFKSKKIPEKET